MTAASRGSRWPTTSTRPAGTSAPASWTWTGAVDRAAAGTDGATVRRPTAPATGTRRRRPRPAVVVEPEPGRQGAPLRPVGRPIVGTSARRATHGALQLGEAQVADVVGGPQRAASRRGGAELHRRPRHQLLHPADAQAQRLPGDGGRGPAPRRRPASAAGAAATSSASAPSSPMRGRHERQHDGLARDELVERRALGVRLGDRREGQRRAGDGGGGGGRDQQPDERLVAVQADERAPAVAQHREQLLVAQVVERRDRGEVGVDVVDEVGRRGRRARCAADRPATPRAGGGPAAADRGAAAARRGRLDAEQGQVGGGDAVDGDDDVAAADGPRGGRAGQQQRLAQAVAQRVEPQVLLERRQRVGERLGDRAGSEHRARRRRQRRDRARLQQAQVHRRRRRPTRRPAGRRRPRPASAARRASWRSTAAGGRGASPVERTSTTRPRRLRTAVQPSTAPDTSWSGPPATAATTMRSWRPVSGSAPNSTPPHTALQHRLHEHGHLGVDEAGASGPVGGGVDLLDGREQRRARRPRRGSTRTRRPSTRRRRPRRSTTSARRPAAARRRRRRATRAARRRVWRAVHAVVSTAPGRVGSPAARASGEVGGLRPDERRVGGAGSESGTTVGRVTTSTA